MSFHRWLTGACLLLLMVFALGANAILFSARSFQHNLVQVDPSSGGIISLADLRTTDDKIAGIEDSVRGERGATVEAQAKFDAAKREADAARAAVEASNAALEERIAQVEARFKIESAPASTYDPVGLSQRLELLGVQPRATPADRAEVATLKDAAKKLQALDDEAADRENAAAEAEAGLKTAGVKVADANRAVLGLKAQFGQNYDRIRNEAVALERGSLFGIGATLVGMHPTFLSTVLVCLMGGLGGILFLFPAYVANRFPVTFVVIIVRLVFGMVTALAFYIVANATLAGFAFMPGQDGAQATSMSLNPFTVSLLGIIAGVMADDIAEWIHNRGRDILGGGRGPTALPQARADAGPPPKGGAVGAAPASGVMGLLDPFSSAAADASQSRVGTDHDGPEPPRGGVVNRG